MKRFVALVLALMLCLSLCACGAGAGSPEKAVEKAFAKYDNAQDMYKALGMDFEAGLKKGLMDELNGESLADLKDELLENWSEIFSRAVDGEDDMVSSLIGADKLDKYREKVANAASLEEFVDLFVEVYMLYIDTYLDEVRELNYFDSFTSESVVEKVDNICVRELEGKDYNERWYNSHKAVNLNQIVETLQREQCFVRLKKDARADSILFAGQLLSGMVFDVADIEAAYSVSFVITRSNAKTNNVDFDDGYYVLETSEGCFLYK